MVTGHSHGSVGGVWGAWCSNTADTSGGTTSGSYTTDAVWQGWNETHTHTLSTDATDAAWIYWNSSGGDLYANNGQGTIVFNSPRVVYELDQYGHVPARAYRRRHRQERREKKRALKLRRKSLHKVELERRRLQSADARARKLLEDVLGLEQYTVYRQTGRILIHGQKFDWIVHSSGKVQRLEKDKVIDLCVRLKDPWIYPTDDNIVGLALTAKLNEDHLSEKANTIRTQDKREAPECAVLELAI